MRGAIDSTGDIRSDLLSKATAFGVYYLYLGDPETVAPIKWSPGLGFYTGSSYVAIIFSTTAAQIAYSHKYQIASSWSDWKIIS